MGLLDDLQQNGLAGLLNGAAPTSAPGTPQQAPFSWAGTPNALMNGAVSFADQAKWLMGGFGNAPQPAQYTGGQQYPTPDDANAYVRNNWPSDGRRLMSVGRPETFYTPNGIPIPPQGRPPTIGEELNGAPPSLRQYLVGRK